MGCPVMPLLLDADGLSRMHRCGEDLAGVVQWVDYAWFVIRIRKDAAVRICSPAPDQSMLLQHVHLARSCVVEVACMHHVQLASTRNPLQDRLSLRALAPETLGFCAYRSVATLSYTQQIRSWFLRLHQTWVQLPPLLPFDWCLFDRAVM